MTCGTHSSYLKLKANQVPKKNTILPNTLRRKVGAWVILWGVPDLKRFVTFSFSGSLRGTLARCRPAEGRIVLRECLSGSLRQQLEEALCHELAHVAVYRLYGRRVRPHGLEWQALMRLAGFEPRTRVFQTTLNSKSSIDTLPRRIFEHRCPVCQAVRAARRPITNWRCAQCMDAGLDGTLAITDFLETPEIKR